MRISRHFCNTVTIAVIIALLGASPVLALEPAGEVEELEGEATVVRNGAAPRPLEEDDDVFEGDRISTKGGASVFIEFEDDTEFHVGENTTLVIDEFVYESNSSKDRFNASLLSGAARFLTGKIASVQPASVSVETPAATIGVRGTNVLVDIEGEGALIGLLDDDDSDRPTAIQVANQAGSVVIDKPNHATQVDGPNSPPSAPFQLTQQTINNIINSITTIQVPTNLPLIRP